MPLNSFSPNTKIKSLKLNANFEGLADGSLIETGAITSEKLQNTIGFRVYLSSPQSLPNATSTKIEFDTESFDSGGDWDADTDYEFTVPLTGKYLFGFKAYVGSLDAGKDQWGYIYVNGSAVSRSKWTSPDANIEHLYSLVDFLTLSQGDTVHFETYQNNGGALNLSSGEEYTNAWGVYLGT